MTCTFWIVIALLINGSFGLNVLDGLKTGVVYQFELTTQTQLTNRDQIKTVDEQESSAAIFAQLLHWDQDSQKRVLVIWADNCVNAVCPRSKDGDPSSPPLKLFSIWRGGRISEVLVPKNTGTRKWDVLRSLLFHLQYELETAKIRNVGFCDSKYSETDPKSRHLYFCRLSEQASLLDKIIDMVNSNFTITSQYFFDASSKLRQLVVKEHYEASNPLFPFANTVAISQSRLKLIEQSQSAHTGKEKEEGVDFGAYVEILKKGGVKRLQRLIPSKKIYASLKALVDLSKSLRSAADVQLLDCLNFLYQGHSPLVQPVLGAVAVAGRKNAQKAAFQFLEQKDEEHLRRQYFIMLAHNLWPSKIASEVLAHFEKSAKSTDDLDNHLAMAAAAVVRRSDDVEIQERLIKTLEHLLSSCKNNQCLETTLRAFRNLAHPRTAEHAVKYFCHKSSAVVREALESIRSTDTKHWTSETLRTLAQVYAGKCPTGNSDSSSRTTAAELLLKVRPDQRWFAGPGAFLLAPLLGKEGKPLRKKEREIYTYTLSKLHDLAEMDEAYKKAMASGVKEILHNDYSRLGIGGLSTVHTTVAADIGIARALSELNMEYSRGVTKRGTFNINLETKRGTVTPILSVGLISRDLDLIAPGSSSFADEDDKSSDSDDESQQLTAGLRLSIMDQLQPPVTFFSGQTALMNILWGANGDPVTAFEGLFLVNEMRGALPLATGHRARIELGSSLWLKMTGSLEVSLWYGTGRSIIANHLAYRFSGTSQLEDDGVSDAKPLLRDETTLSGRLQIDFTTDLELSMVPFHVCLQLTNHPFEVKYRNVHRRFDPSTSKEQTSKRGRLLRAPGHCFVTEPKVARECGPLLERLGRD